MLNKEQFPQVAKEIEKLILDGWSLTLATKKAGVSKKQYYYEFYQSQEYKDLLLKYRSYKGKFGMGLF